MFSDNHRISDQQLQALLLAEWIGKIVLLMPGLTKSYGEAEIFLGTALGLLLMVAALLLILRGAWLVPMDYYTYVKKYEGRGTAVILYLLYSLYFFAQTVLTLFLCGEIAQTYLLPEYTRPVLMAIPALVGYFLARGGLEIRSRVSELLAWFLAAVLLVMLGLALFQVNPARLWDAFGAGEMGRRGAAGITGDFLPRLLRCVAFTAAGFGSIFTIPLVLPETEQKKGWKKKLYLAFLTGCLFLLLVYLCGYGSFGAAGMKRLSWPVIALMSSMDFNGIFFQRWDVFLTALLLVSLFLSVGSGIYYTEKVLTILGGREEKEGAVRIGCVVFAYLLAWWAGSWERLLFFYERIVVWFCVPVLALLILLVKRRRRTRAAVGALAVLAAVLFFLTGCGARELESRRFPLVLELDAREGKLILGCAWPTVKENGSKQTQEEGDRMEEDGAQQGESPEQEEEKPLVNDEKITRVEGSDMEEAVDKLQSLQDRYVDYSQVKAILWGSGLKEIPKLSQEVLAWLEENPVISGNVLVFQGKTRDLSLELIQEHAQGQPGDYLKNLYKNNEEFQKYTSTLKDLLYP